MATTRQLAAAGLRRVTNAACTGAALDLGATVQSWRPRGQSEVLFFSGHALVGVGDEIHGGIPICAPWFGRGRDEVEVPVPHGLVRWVPWRLAEEHYADDMSRLVWELTAADVAHLPGADAYPPDLRFRHDVTFGERLTLRFTVESPTTEFVLDEAFHCYFCVSGYRQVSITGLEGSRYRDYTTDPNVWQVEENPLRINGHTDQIHDHCGEITIFDSDRSVTLRPSGAANTVVWNPGPAIAAALPGFGHKEWKRMVCVEVGNVQANAVTVPAGGSHTLEVTIESR